MKRFARFGGILAALILLLCSLPACSQPRQIAVTETGAQSVVTLAAVGDILVSEAQCADAIKPDGSYDFSPAFAAVTGHIASADLAVGNLEGNFCGAPYDPAVHNYPTELAGALSDAGFDVLQTANTYTIENGLSGLKSTISTLQGAGLTQLGSFSSAEDRTEHGVLIREINGIRIAMIAFTKGVNNVHLPEGAEYCVNLLYTDYASNYSRVNTEGITACVREAAAAKPDIIVAMVHWGSEYDETVSESQKEIETLLLSGGVDVILGTHSHLVGEMGLRQITDADGEEKTVFVAYSLGNFYCDATEPDAQPSAIAQLEFTKYTDGTTEITGADYVPCYVADLGAEAPNRFAVLDVRSAIALYENNYYDRVSSEIYELLQQIPEQLKEQIVSLPEAPVKTP